MNGLKDTPKVLLLCATGELGGTKHMVQNLARMLAQNYAMNIWTVFTDHGGSSKLLKWCQEEGVPAEVNAAVPRIQQQRSRQEILALRAFVRNSGAQIVNLHYGGNHISFKDVLTVRLAGRNRCVVTVHHAVPYDNPKYAKSTRLGAKLAHKVVVSTQIMKRMMTEIGVSANKISVVPCGVPIPARFPTRQEARAAYCLPMQAFVVSTLARLVPHKGIDDLIEAFARIPDPQGHLRLLIAGGGSERQNLEELAERRLPGRAFFAGRVDCTDEIYAAANVYALPSREEGFGLVYIEAAMHGVPSIGARVGGVPDVIEDEKTGLLVEAGDIDALTHVLTRLRDNDDFRAQLGNAARLRANAEFTDVAMAKGYIRVFES